MSLNDKKTEKICRRILIDLNATQAAIRAGYSPETAGSIGSENLKKPEIRACIEKAMAERSKRTGINQDRIIMELAKIGLLNPKDLVDFDEATVKEGASAEDLAAIASVRVKRFPTKDGEGIEREIKMHDKTKALELLGKHFGMFKDKVEVSGLEDEKKKLDDILQQMRGDG